MTDLVDDNKKPIVSFSAQQSRQEVNEGKIKFHFATKERQRKLNFGKQVVSRTTSRTFSR